MILIRSFLLLMLLSFGVIAQQSSTPKPYFQQQVNYDIQVTLNDIEHSIEGVIEMEYTNNSLEELDFIYMHLWPNAYKNTETAFAKQMLENGDSDFYYSRPSQRGYIDSLAFTVNDKEATYKAVETDYGKLILNKPLKTGETIVIKTPFTVKIPESFSRLGHVKQSYQLTQWYPKPAVYDREGWHPMSYLDQGEFYSEFGCFDVKITLPSNYIVGSTGDLQNEEEIAFLKEKSNETLIFDSLEIEDAPIPASSPVFKTLEYKQCNIHDFAWFADKRFHVKKGEVTLESGRKVDTWAMFTDVEANLWQNSIEYINDAVSFYSEKVGEYPYNQCTAVQSALSAGAGMEYPQVTVIGESFTADGLEDVIVHEVGHNWFYGQLAFNERKYPFMDEGYNTYYDQRYKREKYPNKRIEMPKALKPIIEPNELPARDVWELAYQIQARQNKDQAVGLPSEEFTSTNYGAMVYSKTGIMIDYLAAYLGQEKFDKVMKTIYERWEFKHPQPRDFEMAFNQLTFKNLDWFFNDLIKTNKKVDYQLWKVEKNAETIGKDVFHKVMVLNHPDNVAGPFTLTAIKANEPIYTVWYDGFTGNEKVLFPAMEYDKMVLDYQHNLPEYNRKNNSLKAKGLLKKVEPFKLKLLGNIEDPYKTQIFVSPAVAFNTENGFQLGLATYNSIVPSTKLEYTLAGMYAFKSNSVTGIGEVAYNIRPKQGLFARIRPAVNFSSFADGNFKIRVQPAPGIPREDRINGNMNYFRFAPEVKIDFRKKSLRSKEQHSLQFKSIHLFKGENAEKYLTDGITADNLSYNGYDTPREYYLNQLIYKYTNRRKIMPYKASAMLEQHKDFVKASLKAKLKMNYPSKSKGISVEVFAGAFLWDNDIFLESESYNENNFYQFGLNDVGANDYAYDDLWVGRQEPTGFWTRQVNTSGFNGGFKIHHGYANSILADKWLATLNLEIESPLSIPLLNALALYVNVGVNNRSIKQQAKNGSQTFINNPDISTGLYENKVFYETGLAVKIVPNIFEVYVPILLSKDLREKGIVDGKANFFKQITFMINFNKLNYIKGVRNISL